MSPLHLFSLIFKQFAIWGVNSEFLSLHGNIESHRNSMVFVQYMLQQAQSQLEQTEVTAVATVDNTAPAILCPGFRGWCRWAPGGDVRQLGALAAHDAADERRKGDQVSANRGCRRARITWQNDLQA
jgi:hypothetical protein